MNNENAVSVSDEKKAVKPKKKPTAMSYAVSFFIKITLTAIILVVLFTFVFGVHICHVNTAFRHSETGTFV